LVKVLVIEGELNQHFAFMGTISIPMSSFGEVQVGDYLSHNISTSLDVTVREVILTHPK
jgi:hypothetical protein